MFRSRPRRKNSCRTTITSVARNKERIHDAAFSANRPVAWACRAGRFVFGSVGRHALCGASAKARTGAEGRRLRSARRGGNGQVQNPGPRRSTATSAGSSKAPTGHLAQVRRHQRRQRRRPVELLQGRPGGLSRHRLQLQRQGRPVSLVPHRRQPLGAGHQRGRRDRLVEVDLGRRRSPPKWSRPSPPATPTGSRGWC